MRRLIAVWFALITFSGVLSLLPGSAVPEEGGSNGEPTGDMAEWTFMVYMAADNNLEGAGIEDLNEMETVGSSEDLNYIVQVDRAEGYDTSNGDWKGAKRYRMEKDDDSSIVNTPELEDMGEINMGDPDTLVDFIIWATDNYPAKHYFLDLWNHGGAFWGVCWDDSEGDGDPITMLEMSDALDTATRHMGRNIDIIGFDACLMAQLAILYQVKDYSDYAVASGFVEPGDGWPYERIFSGLDKKPDMSPSDLGSEIVNDYMDSYTDNNDDPNDSYMVTMALFDLSKIVDLTQELNRYSMLLATNNIPHNLQVKLARSRAECYAYPPNPGPFKLSPYTLFDLIDLLEKMDNYVLADSELDASGRKVIQLAEDMIVDSRADSVHQDATGLTLYFPNEIDAKYDPLYSELDFARESYWDEYLRLFPDPLSNADNTPPSITIDVKRGENIDPGNGTFLITGTVFDLQDTPTVNIQFDEGEWREAVVVPSNEFMGWYFEWDVGSIESKNSTISVKASDPSGSESGVITREVSIGKGTGTDTNEAGAFPWGTAVLVVVVLALGGAGIYLFAKKKKEPR